MFTTDYTEGPAKNQPSYRPGPEIPMESVIKYEDLMEESIRLRRGKWDELDPTGKIGDNLEANERRRQQAARPIVYNADQQ